MKTFKEILSVYIEFSFFDHYNIGRAVELNNVRDFTSTVLTEADFRNEDTCVRHLRVLDHMSLMIPNNDVKSIDQKIKNLTVGVLQMLCLERLYKEEAAEKDGCYYNKRKRNY